MPINSLYLSNVGPFEEIEFEFDHQVNVFTGPNNSGKSSALWALGDITVCPFEFPDKLLRPEHHATFRVNVKGQKDAFVGQLPCRPYSRHERGNDHGQGYWTAERIKRHLNILKIIGYSKFIPALRRSTDFRSQGPKPEQKRKREEERYIAEIEEEYYTAEIEEEHYTAEIEEQLRRQRTLVSPHADLVSDEAVIEKIIELDYRSYLKGQPEYLNIIHRIAKITSEITQGFNIEFIGVDEDRKGFFPKFGTVGGSVPLNTLSQGTQSIVQWLAHLLIGYAEYYDFPDELGEKSGILIIDEIDAHLHVSWQQRIIPTLTRHFPNLQIFCSTHSPLMLAGLKQGQIQLLRRDEKGKVSVSRNESDIYSWTADEILRQLLELPTPTDLATSDRLDRLQQLRQKQKLSNKEAKELDRLRHMVSQDLLRGPTSVQVEEFANELKRAIHKSSSDSTSHAARRKKTRDKGETDQ